MTFTTQDTTRKMRRLANLLGCREGEIVSSSSEEAEVRTILLPSNMCIVISTFAISCVHVCQIPDDTILSQSISRGKKQGTRSAYQLKPRGKAPNRYILDDYVNRAKKVVVESDEVPARRSDLRRMRNDEPSSSEEEEQEVQQQQEQRQRTKRMAV